jgi:hypothetical protein
MDTTNQYDEFLEAVERLRQGDAGVRATAHTSNVAADGWPPETADDEATR